MTGWSDVEIKVEHRDTGKPVYSTITVAWSAWRIQERMMLEFTTPQDARRAHDAHTKGEEGPEASQWESFVKDVDQMHERHASVGIDHARLVKVDFSKIELEARFKYEWGKDNEFER